MDELEPCSQLRHPSLHAVRLQPAHGARAVDLRAHLLRVRVGVGARVGVRVRVRAGVSVGVGVRVRVRVGVSAPCRPARTR